MFVFSCTPRQSDEMLRNFNRKWRIQQRVVLATLTFLAIVNHVLITNCFSLALTQMVSPNAINDSVSAANNSTASCPINSGGMIHGNETLIVDAFGKNVRFDWSQSTQGVILSAFFFGFVLMNIPGGQLANRFGAKPVIVTALVVAAIASFLTPMVVFLGGAPALITLRFIMGLSQGGLFPASNALLSAWAPLHERGRLASFIYCGAPAGMLIGNFLSGLLLQWHGWHIVFYVFGLLGCIISILYIYLCSSYPSNHPYISEEEQFYLITTIGKLERGDNLPVTPWRSIVTSGPVLVLIAVGMIGEMGNYMLYVFEPIYLSDVVHMDPAEIGLFTSMPWIIYICVSLACGSISDWIITRDFLSVTMTRKLFLLITSLADGIFQLAASFSGCNASLVGTFFSVAIAIHGLHTSCTYINPNDLSPNYASTISALMYALGASLSIFIPIIFARLAPNSLILEWRRIFWIIMGSQFVKILLFAVWGSAEIQPWNASSYQVIT